MELIKTVRKREMYQANICKMEIIIIHGCIITDPRIFMTDLINEPTKRADFETPTYDYISLQQLWQILPTSKV